MEIMCVNDNGKSGTTKLGITKGKIYKVDLNNQRNNDYYYFIDNSGTERGWWKYRFEIVENSKLEKKLLYPQPYLLNLIFTRKQLRQLAKQLNVKIGKDKWDTAVNLAIAGKVSATITIEQKQVKE